MRNCIWFNIFYKTDTKNRKSHLFPFFIFIFLFSIVFTPQGLLAAKNKKSNRFVVGSITSAIGGIDIISLVTGDRREGKDGVEIYEDEQIRTDSRARVKISLIDGSQAEVWPFSIVNLKRESAYYRGNAVPLAFRMLTGKVRLKISYHSEKKFYIKTPTVLAAANGAEVGVVCVMNDAYFIVYDGEAEVSNRAPSLQRSYILRTRQIARIPVGEIPSGIRFIDHSMLHNILAQYEITRGNKIRRRMREPMRLFDELVKKAE